MGFGFELLGVIRIELRNISGAEEKQAQACVGFGRFVAIGFERPRGCEAPQATEPDIIASAGDAELRYTACNRSGFARLKLTSTGARQHILRDNLSTYKLASLLERAACDC